MSNVQNRRCALFVYLPRAVAVVGEFMTLNYYFRDLHLPSIFASVSQIKVPLASTTTTTAREPVCVAEGRIREL